MIRGKPRLTFVTTCGGQAAPHARAARLPVIAIIMVSRGCGPLKVLLAPLFVALDALLAVVGGDIRRRSLIAARYHLPSSLGWKRHDRLIASGVLGGDVGWRIECVPEEVAMLALVQAPCIMLGLCTCTPLASQAVGLWLNTLALPPQWGLRRKICRG
jgi:hypothetical protein